MIDKRYSPDFRIRIQDDGWATIWDDTGFIELAPDEVELLRDFLAAGPGAKRPEQDPNPILPRSLVSKKMADQVIEIIAQTIEESPRAGLEGDQG